MDKEGLYQLQKIDCNCNDCFFMVRNFETKKFWDSKEINKDQKNASHRINYGDCYKFNKPVSFIPNTCQIETQCCFKHRKELNQKTQPHENNPITKRSDFKTPD